MKSLHKFDRQETEKSAKKHASSVSFSLSLAAVTIGLLSVLIPLGGGISSVFASDKKFDIDIDIDEDPIKRGDTQDITVTVKNDDTGKKVSNAEVKLTVYPPDSDSTTATDETDDGEAKFKVKIDDDAETGEYDVKVRVSKNGFDTKTVNTSFDVIKNHHDNDDNDGDGNSSAAASAASGSAASSAATGRGSSAAAAASLHSAAAAAASG
jgi:5-hydroxyisourate hydrolase-like protein (transthyretin family)